MTATAKRITERILSAPIRGLIYVLFRGAVTEDGERGRSG